MSNIITSVDLGSNSFRVLMYDFTQDKPVGDFETAVGTADGLKQTGNISNEALERILAAIDLSIQKLNYNPTNTIAVTTSAMRQAKNSQYILDTIANKTGIKFSIISGDKEAKLTLLGLQYALKKQNFNHKDLILVDIGGGSTELVFVKDEQAIYKSFELGIVTLTQSDNKEEVLNEFKQSIKEYITTLPFDIKELNIVATSGTPTTIAALKNGLNYTTYNKNIINGEKVYLGDLEYYAKYLTRIPIEEAQSLTGTNRVQFIGSGIEIFNLIYKILEKDYSIVFDEGLREGVVVDAFLNQQ